MSYRTDSRNGSKLARRMRTCSKCGRMLEDLENCECDRLPRDGMRATCPAFAARTNYRRQ